MPKYVLTDSCFWLGLVDPRDQHHSSARALDEIISAEQHTVLLPWPCLYESISTRLIRNRTHTLKFEHLLKRPPVRLLDDTGYRNAALSAVFAASHIGQSYALADGVIREMIKDRNLRIDYLLTFNAADFEDVCQARRIELIG